METITRMNIKMSLAGQHEEAMEKRYRHITIETRDGGKKVNLSIPMGEDGRINDQGPLAVAWRATLIHRIERFKPDHD